MSNVSVTLVSGQTAVVGTLSSRENYEVEVASGARGADGVGIAAAVIDNGALRLTLSNGAILNAGAITVSDTTGTITFTDNTIGEFSNGAVNIKAGTRTWAFNTNGGLSFPDSTTQTTAYTGNANNAAYLGGIIASQYAYANAIPSVTGYQTTAGLAANVATLSANNASYLGGYAANQYAYANAVPSIAGLQTTAGLASNVATLSANNSSYLGGVAAGQYAYVNAIPSVAGFQTTADLSANVATLTSNNTLYLGGIAANQYAYANATVSFNSITTGVPRLPANTATNVIGILAGGGSRIGLTYLDTNTDRVKVWNSSNTAWLTLATTADIVTTNTGNITFVASTIDAGANADLIIKTNCDDPGASPAISNSTWTFTKYGSLIFPNGNVQSTAYPGGFSANGALELPGGSTLQERTWTSSITNIISGNTTFIEFTDSEFDFPETGQIDISGVEGMTEINDTWYFQSSGSNQIELFYFEDRVATIDSSGWGSYVANTGAVSLVAETELMVNGNRWKFSRDGSTSFPPGKQVSFNDNGNLYIAAGGNFPWSQSGLNLVGGEESAVSITSLDTRQYGNTQFNNWNFKRDGSLEFPGGYRHDGQQSFNVNAGSPPTVVFTSTSPNVQSIKAIVTVTASQEWVNGDYYDVDTQVCEMLITVKQRFMDNGGYWIRSAVATVYGVTHTSDAPLATFTVNYVENFALPAGQGSRNVVQILAEPTAAVTGSNIWVQTVATEIIFD